MKDKIIAACLLLIMVLNFMDVVTDITLKVPLWHIIEEAVIVLFSGSLAAYLILDMRRRTKELETLSHSLLETEEHVNKISKQFKEIRHRYSEIIQQQFRDWELSQSEQEVAMLMLKGLNFQEIASLRNTKEKTCRQQASSIYAKSGLQGRHELSAWFIEDFMSNENTQES